MNIVRWPSQRLVVRPTWCSALFAHSFLIDGFTAALARIKAEAPRCVWRV
jgi:hypothetical protein